MINEHDFPICDRCGNLMPKDSVWIECDDCIEKVFSET